MAGAQTLKIYGLRCGALYEDISLYLHPTHPRKKRKTTEIRIPRREKYRCLYEAFFKISELLTSKTRFEKKKISEKKKK